MMQIIMRLKPPWDIVKLTEEYPSMTILDWCNFSTDFYELRTTKPEELRISSKAFLSLRRRLGFHLQKKLDVSSDQAIFVMKCNHVRRGSIEDIMQRHSCLPLFPLVFHQGWIKVTGLSLDKNQLWKMFSRLSRVGELKVDVKATMKPEQLKENFVLSSSAFISNLTKKQAGALLAAVDFGYYNVPRKAKFEEIARDLKIPTTTYEEHVRKAENKIITAVAPYLSIFYRKRS